MLFEYTYDCLRVIVSSVEYVTNQQLKRFFMTAKDAGNLDFLITRLVSSGFMSVVDEENIVYQYRRAKPLTSYEVGLRVKAFWPIANHGYKLVQEAYVEMFPTQLGFIAIDPETKRQQEYSITVCPDLNTAQIAGKQWRKWLMSDQIDLACHLALVERGQSLEGFNLCGFSHAVWLDDDYNPYYIPLS